MPNTRSAKKTLRQSAKRTARMSGYKTKVKTVAKSISALLAENKRKEAAELLPSFYKAIDKAHKHHALHKNTAARRKSTLTRRVVNDANNVQATTAAQSNSQAT
jgi:small subunit ribosomal protein S20